MYQVQHGDTLARIARRFHVSVRTIRQANHLKNDRIKPGQRLKILISSKQAAGRKPCADVYRVRAGDTLGAIARRCNVSKKQLRALNPRAVTRPLHVGQFIRIASGKQNQRRDFLSPPRP